MYELKVKKLHKDAKMPSFANPTDAGMDIYSISDDVIKSGEYKLIKTGIAIELPKRTEAQIRPKSGLALKYGVTTLNSPGTIDEDYRGEVGVIMINHGKDDFIIDKGMKIAQMVIKPTYEVSILEANEISSTKRGEGGFGSTGRW